MLLNAHPSENLGLLPASTFCLESQCKETYLLRTSYVQGAGTGCGKAEFDGKDIHV